MITNPDKQVKTTSRYTNIPTNIHRETCGNADDRRMPTSRSTRTFIIDVLPLDEPSTHADKQFDM
jgi:hypothetical protein